MRRAIAAFAPVLLLAVGVTLAGAHDLFIKLDSYFLPPESAVRIPILNGTFELSESSVAEDRVADVSLVTDQGRREMAQRRWGARGDTTFLALRTGPAGTYVLGISTLPRELALPAADFNEYLAHDGIPDVLAQRRADGELDKDVVERYSKHVKAVFQVGDRRSAGFDFVFGHPAELVPITNPYEGSVGSEFAFRAIVDGRPVPNQLVLAGGQGAAGLFEERSARTDSDGVVRFRIEEAGRWYVKFIHMEKTDAAGLDYESKWATLTFEVK